MDTKNGYRILITGADLSAMSNGVRFFHPIIEAVRAVPLF